MRVKHIPFAVALILLISSCNKKIDQTEADDQAINSYLTSNNLTATKDPSGLYWIMTAEGTGTSPTAASTVEVKYKGSLLNGTVFDQTAADKTFTYPLSGLILGWQIGIPMMKEGGKAKLLIPSQLGYGSSNLGVIPPNSVLIFDIELIDVK
jgi:FKBP-type peptidyl-prolyl cis-trans isomerase FkpA